jgi:hypothetical protein
MAIVNIYDRVASVDREAAPLARYPMQVGNPQEFEADMRLQGWDVAGRWFNAPLHPAGAAASRVGYLRGTSPMAEQLARTIVNLPTHRLVSPADAEEIMSIALHAGASPLLAADERL